MAVNWIGSVICHVVSTWERVERIYSQKKGWCYASHIRTKRNAQGKIILLIKITLFLVTMVKTSLTMPWQFITITQHHLVILIIRFLHLVALHQETIKLNYLISAQIVGKQNHHFHIVISKYDFVISEFSKKSDGLVNFKHFKLWNR